LARAFLGSGKVILPLKTVGAAARTNSALQLNTARLDLLQPLGGRYRLTVISNIDDDLFATIVQQLGWHTLINWETGALGDMRDVARFDSETAKRFRSC